MASSDLGVSGLEDRELRMEEGISVFFLSGKYSSITSKASPFVVGSGEVGPEAMASSGLPTTSERIKLNT